MYDCKATSLSSEVPCTPNRGALSESGRRGGNRRPAGLEVHAGEVGEPIDQDLQPVVQINICIDVYATRELTRSIRRE